MDIKKTLAAPRMIIQKQIKRTNMKPLGNMTLERKMKNMMK